MRFMKASKASAFELMKVKYIHFFCIASIVVNKIYCKPLMKAVQIVELMT